MSKKRIQELEDQNNKLRRICADLQIGAKRYANGRSTYYVGMVNDCTKELVEMGVKCNPGAEGTIWAEDGMGRSYDQLTEEHFRPPNNPVAMGYVWGLPPRTRLDDHFCELIGTRDIHKAVEELARLKAIENSLPTIVRQVAQLSDLFVTVESLMEWLQEPNTQHPFMGKTPMSCLGTDTIDQVVGELQGNVAY